MVKEVRCSICGDSFPEKDAKYEPARPVLAGIYVLCPRCYPRFMVIYRGSKECPKCHRQTILEYKPAFFKCQSCGEEV